MPRFHLMRFVDNVRRPLGIFQGVTAVDAMQAAQHALCLPLGDMDVALDEHEIADVDRLVFLENVRAVGAVILACERSEGRPDTFHKVGDRNTRPLYNCDINDYVPITPDDVAKRVAATVSFLQRIANLRLDKASSEQCAALIRESRNLVVPG